MSFLTPLALLLAVLAIPILLLYMLRLRRRETPVSSTYLWVQVLRDREANTPWQRLRRNLLLILQLLLLALLIFALMRPYVETPAVSAGRVTVLLDASASMNATDVSPTRFAAAQQAALDIVNTLSAGDAMTVIRVANAPEVLANATDDRNLLRQAIRGARPSQGAADWSAALTLAAAKAVGVEDYNVVIISDGGLPPDVPAIPGEVRYVPIGASGENVGLTALAVRARAGGTPQLFAEVTNFGQQEAEIIFSLYLDNALHSAHRRTVPPTTAVGVSVTDLPGEFTVLSASLTPAIESPVPDYLPTDNTAWTVYNPAGAGRVLLMTPGNLYLHQALASLPGMSAFQGSLERGLPQSEQFDLYVFDGWLPPDGDLPAGDLLLIDPPETPITPLFTVTGHSTATDNPRVARDDPRTTYVSFANVHVLDFKTLDGVDWADPLIAVAGGPLVLAGEVDGRQVAIFTFDLHRSDLPLQIAWPILLANLMQWYTPARAVNAPQGLQVAETLVITPPFEAETVRVTRPDGAITTLPVESRQLIFADTSLPGIYTVDTYRGAELIQSEPVAVNLFDRMESDIQPADSLLIGQTTVTEAAREEIGQQEFWPLIVLAALAVLTLEWVLYHRGMRPPRLRTATVAGGVAGRRR